MKVIVLESEARLLARILHALVRGDPLVSPLTLRDAALLKDLAEKLVAPSSHVALSRDDAEYVLELVMLEQQGAQEDEIDAELNMPSQLDAARQRVYVAGGVRETLERQL